MQITHEEAHSLIQLKSDNALGIHKQQALTQHLLDCADCTTYADEIRNTEDILRSTIQKHWNRPAPSIQLDAIHAKKSFVQNAQALLATRSTIMGIAMLFIGFALWQFMQSGTGSSNPLIRGASPIPTPSLQLTSTQQEMENCEHVRYQVRPGDTLESVARQFSISKEVLMDTNNLQTESISEQSELTLLLCNLTPTGTAHPPVFTITPFTETITNTPG